MTYTLHWKKRKIMPSGFDIELDLSKDFDTKEEAEEYMKVLKGKNKNGTTP